MSAMANTREVSARPAAHRGRSPGANEEIQAAFQDFRESAVRLAERVTDLSGPPEDPIAAAQADLRLLRSIFSKWSPDVLVALHAVPSIGFEELRRSLSGISPRVLSLKLKELEQNGLVRREILDTRPPRVRYTLRHRGWTVAWLAHPVLLYLRFSEPGPSSPAPAADANSSEE
jgi:DNA-binding HxlR family transcriptional regulator